MMNAKIGIGFEQSKVTLLDDEVLLELVKSLPDIKLTAEQVLINYTKWRDDLEGNDEKKDMMMQLGAGMIYRNGIHQNTGGEYKMNETYNWGQVRSYLGLVSSKKVTITRYLISVMKKIHDLNDNKEHNMIYRSAMKYGLEDEFGAVSSDWNFWGAFYHPDINDADAENIYNLQQEIIEAQKTVVAEQKKRNE